MTPKQLKAARKRLGLSARGLAMALDLPSQWSDRTVRKWESDDSEVPGPIAKCVRFMLKHGVDGDR